jgi:hypothetical protein
MLRRLYVLNVHTEDIVGKWAFKCTFIYSRYRYRYTVTVD